MIDREKVARALAQADIEHHRERFAASKSSASMSPDFDAIAYIEAELNGQMPKEWQRRLLRADAAIAAVLEQLREPSEAMLRAVEPMAGNEMSYDADDACARRVWQAMLDAATK